MSNYKLTCWSDEYIISANLAEASAPIKVDGDSTPYQTADCCHSSEKMRTLIASWLYSATPDHDADFDEVAKLEPIEDAE